MSGAFKSHDVAKRALRKVSRFSINDSAPDPEALAETLFWLDLIVGHTVAVNPLPWLWPIDVLINLVADQASYDFDSTIAKIGTSGPDFVLQARRIDSGGNHVPIDIISRDTFDKLEDPDLTGPPESVYINRLVDSPKVFIHPIPDDTEYDIELSCQVFAPDLTSSKNNTGMGLAAGFEFWAVTRTASEIGDGPVITMPNATIRRWKGEASVLLTQLVSNHVARENTDERQVAYRNLG